MPRQPRFILPGQPQHIIQRGNNRSEIFRRHADYQFYLDKLQQAIIKHQCDIHAYVLMTNHVHLLVTPRCENSISKMMQMLGRYYVQYFNSNYQRTGTLWEGRYKACLIDSERYLLSCMRYIELNPVRAGMVSRPADYRWSSNRCTAHGEPDVLLTMHSLYCRLGQDKTERQLAYRQLFSDNMEQNSWQEIRDATNKAWALGDDRFKTRIAAQLERQAAPKSRGGDRKSAEYRRQSEINRV